MKAMILSAGLGTRLRPITEKFAKPAVPFLNIPLLYYPFYLMERTKRIDGYVLNTHHRPEQIEALASSLANGPFGTRDIAFSHEPGAPLGSGGGIWKARPHLEGGGNFLVANGDEVILPHDPEVMTKFIQQHERTEALATILVMKHPLVGTQFGGVWADASGRVRGFGKNGAAFGSDVNGYHYIGLLLLADRVFQYLPEGESNILYDALMKGIAAGERVDILCSEFTWFETGNPHDFLDASVTAIDLLADGKGQDASCLRQICDLYWRGRSSLVVRDGLKMVLAKSAHVDPNVSIEGHVVLGEHVKIRGRSSLRDSVALSDAASLEDADVVSRIWF